ncbi:P-loop containing nucleoside triphosphate hydrolase protein [Ceraceosorus guamensis]|uniref:P-loop containing nucleoside triphosphate hydrolase protein n=1 Tax=Ceraceosorus guamensis TaxID=1522189 RepID=A0A316VX13_9BASI|nr:P-loop containing nucleoside triphosphate hydrolase protein [Ceraceosorus guamensis]PWN41992.1 P-loop containing nucleoside triphosphate hydrolase protein [Ceraceosorus guamensis]
MFTSSRFAHHLGCRLQGASAPERLGARYAHRAVLSPAGATHRPVGHHPSTIGQARCFSSSGSRSQHSRVAPGLRAATTIGGLALIALSGLVFSISHPIHSDEGQGSSDKWKHEATLLCLVGPQGSGKTTHAKRLAKRWPEFSILSEIPASSSLEKGKRYILDGYPRSLEEARRIESEALKDDGKIFCLLYFDLPLDDYIKRHNPDEQRKKAFKEQLDQLEPLIKQYRDQGNICEISADWNSADEVWEQVEAKTEQIIELRDMGEL